MTTPVNKIILGPVIGGLSYDRVNLWARASGPAVLHAWLSRQDDLSDARLVGNSALKEATGYAGVVPIRELTPDTTYYYAMTLEPDSRPEVVDFQPFTTFPPPHEKRSFNFVFGSCFLPRNEDAGETFTAINGLRESDDLRFLLMIGDQIYADKWKHNGIGKIAVSKNDYRQVYEYTWSQASLRQLLTRLPAFMILDDHEIDNDWHWDDFDRRWASIPFFDRIGRWFEGRPPQERYLPLHRVRDGLQVYWEHQGMHAPAMRLPPKLNLANQYELRPHDPGSLAYTFYFGGAAFFVLDARTMRVRGKAGNTVLGEGQWRTLETWLEGVKDTYAVKFIVTSSAFLFNMLGDYTGDRWSGFKDERDRLLHLLAHEGVEGVYFLAGDIHSGHAVSAELYGPLGKRIPIWEFCSSPFEQDPNWFSKFTFFPVLSGALQKHKLHFDIGANNFGIVRVNFDNPKRPLVQFELHYEKKGEWKTRTVPEG
ncbi:MAG: alkaline phosphatase family protein [Anaerolineales bacterium]|nr:alkaline phosphatase family protein [Anaerolineales bacterium]